MSRLQRLDMLDLRPDPRRPALADMAARNLFYRGTIATEHTTLAVGNTSTTFIDELLRVREVQVGTVAGGTVTVQVQAEGRDLFDDTTRPVSGGEVQRPTNSYLMPPGTPLATVIEATSGVPTGEANVVIETEPLEVRPRRGRIELHGKNRLLGSRRREAEAADRGEELLAPGLTRTARPDATDPGLASPIAQTEASSKKAYLEERLGQRSGQR